MSGNDSSESPSPTAEMFYRNLRDALTQCGAMEAAVDARDFERTAIAIREVASAWATAKASLERLSEATPAGATAHADLCAAHKIIGHLFRRAWTQLSDCTPAEFHARSTLRQLAAALDVPLDPSHVQVLTVEAPARVQAPGATVPRQGRGAMAPLSRHGDEPSGPRPLYVRALDAFEAFYRQLWVVSQRMTELRIAFDTKPPPSIVLAAADLQSALGVLYARLELLEVVTNDDAGRELWTHPMMALMRSQLRALLQDGTAYVSRHPEDWRVLQQLRRLEARLDTEEQLVREMAENATTSGEPTVDIMAGNSASGQRVVVVNQSDSQSDGSRLPRCRMRRPWRRKAWIRRRRRELP